MHENQIKISNLSKKIHNSYYNSPVKVNPKNEENNELKENKHIIPDGVMERKSVSSDSDVSSPKKK